MSNVLIAFLELGIRDQKELAAEILQTTPDKIIQIGKSDTHPADDPHIRAKTEHGQVYYLPLDPDADLSAGDPEPEPVAKDPYEMTKTELSAFAGEIGVKKSGTKEVLLDRIVQHQATTADH